MRSFVTPEFHEVTWEFREAGWSTGRELGGVTPPSLLTAFLGPKMMGFSKGNGTL